MERLREHSDFERILEDLKKCYRRNQRNWKRLLERVPKAALGLKGGNMATWRPSRATSFPVEAEWLIGSWSLQRAISDGSRGTGTARIAPVSTNVLSFHEVVSLNLASGETIAGSRSFTHPGRRPRFGLELRGQSQSRDTLPAI